MRRLLILSAISLLALTTGAASAELKIFASRAIWTVLEEVGPSFERTTGHKLNVTTGLSPAFAKRITAGELFDVMFAPPASLDAYIKDGKLDAGTTTGSFPAITGGSSSGGETSWLPVAAIQPAD